MSETDRIQQFYIGKVNHSNIANLIKSPELHAPNLTERRKVTSSLKSKFAVHKAGELESFRKSEQNNAKVSVTEVATSRSMPRITGRKSDSVYQANQEGYFSNRAALPDSDQILIAEQRKRHERLKELIEGRLSDHKPLTSLQNVGAITQLPILPIREEKNKQARGKSEALESPNLSKYEALAQRYGLGSKSKKRTTGADQSTLQSELLRQQVSLGASSQVHENYYQKTNRSNLQNMMTSSNVVKSNREAELIDKGHIVLQQHDPSQLPGSAKEPTSETQDSSLHGPIRKFEAASKLSKEKVEGKDNLQSRSFYRAKLSNKINSAEVCDGYRQKSESVHSQLISSNSRPREHNQSLQTKPQR